MVTLSKLLYNLYNFFYPDSEYCFLLSEGFIVIINSFLVFKTNFWDAIDPTV